ncbi:ATP/GTP-binding protein [Chloroflexota bacterium]
MLIQFRIKNFKSFNNEQVLSLVASADTDLPDNRVSTPALKTMKLIKSVIMYGANASGKSNLVSAIKFVKDFVRKSYENNPDAPIPIHPFRLDIESSENPTEFEITFIHKDIRYEYGFSADQDRVYEEWLIAYPKGAAQVWFERPSEPNAKETDWYFGRQLKGEKYKLVPLTRSNALFLSVAAQFNHPQLSTVYEWFAKYLQVISDDLPRELLEFITLRNVRKNKDLHSKVKNLLKIADLGIADFSIEEKSTMDSSINIPPDAPEEIRTLVDTISRLSETIGKETKQISVVMQHQIRSDDDTGVRFNIRDESQGTRRLFGLSGLLFSTLQEGAVLIIDELDASLHPVLARELVKMFHNPKINTENAQIIFNTHDTTLLDLTLFRRDQIWFIEKDNSGSSHIYSLLEFKPRKTEAISKGYLQGRYGAIPFLSNVEDFLAYGS